MFGVACLIEDTDRRYWLYPAVKYSQELQARVTSEHLTKLFSHFQLPEGLYISFFVQIMD